MGLLLTGLGWIVVTGLLASNELAAARTDLKALRSSATVLPEPSSVATRGVSSGERAQQAARSAAGHAERAHWLTTGPAWYVAAHLPGIGGPFETVCGTAEALDRLTGEALPDVVRTASRLTADAGGSHINLSELRRSAPELERAGRAAAKARAEVARLPRRTWLPSVDRVRSQLLEGLDRMAHAVENAAVGARLLPAMLGEDGARRYLLVFQNPAEARGTGGMPGAYSVLTTHKGVLALPAFGRDTDMATARPKINLGAEFQAMYAPNDSVNTWPNTNMSPHFPYAARIWSAAWLDKSGERVDGVLSLDPAVLARLLAASGPARTTDGTLVTAQNVVDLTERTNYVMYRDPARRKGFLLDVARAAAGRLLTAVRDPYRRPAMLLGLYEVLRNGQMTAWSAHATEQRELAARPVGGSLPEGPGPYAGLVVNNAAGTKLDYYLDRTLEWSSSRCTAAGREVTVKAVITNRAPDTGLPTYVTDRLDMPDHETHQGDNRLLVSYFATAGAELVGATLDGKRTVMSSGLERGHPVYTFDVEMPVGKSRTLTLYLREPPSGQAPTVLRQRLARPLRVTVLAPRNCPAK
ncbi:DUF4012 domain-containing protein [Streptomyces sp. AK02-04a]|uniref:DUF4012 domain-containing protein n=1 Tax=Streptomyces sp. AK02-04a TaxID=3028649 RepID=UPI0029A19FA9|nr:DUF4012 domain-containing protein [Streptomyces sp. AK02-04a]MDX3763430.1 DUF4012 domain-containing protein [Streptomyces sp. AK02-04a]